MTSHTRLLAQKRRDLQLRCALQRQEVAHLSGDIEARLAGADRVLGFVNAVAKQPAILLVGLVGALWLGPWRTLRWATQGAFLFSAYRKVRQFLPHQ